MRSWMSMPGVKVNFLPDPGDSGLEGSSPKAAISGSRICKPLEVQILGDHLSEAVKEAQNDNT